MRIKVVFKFSSYIYLNPGFQHRSGLPVPSRVKRRLATPRVAIKLIKCPCIESKTLIKLTAVTKYKLFSYNKNVNFPDISVGNNTINETSVTKFLGIHIDKKLNFVNHITEMSMKVAKSIGLSYKLNSFLPETILHENVIYFTYSSILIIWYRGMAWNISK